MFTSGAERGEFLVDWRLPGLKDGPALGARLIELAERAAAAHLARSQPADEVSEVGVEGARIAPPSTDSRAALVRWSGGSGDRA